MTALRPTTDTHSRLSQLLASHDWLVVSVLAYLEHDSDDVYGLWLLAIEDDDDADAGARDLEAHCVLSVSHARNLAMLHSCWTALLKLPPLKRASNVGDPTLHETTVHTIVNELTRLDLAPRGRADRYPHRRLALMTAVGSVARTSDTASYYNYAAAGIADPPCASLLTLAAREGHLESVVWLHYFTKYDQAQALDEAVKHGHVDVVVWLLAHAHDNVTVEFQEIDAPALGVMVWRRRGRSVYYTMTRKWGFASSLPYEASAVSLAAAAGDLDAVQQLFAHPFFKAHFTCTVAFAAISSGRLALLQFLLDHCPDVFDRRGRTRPAVRNGDVDVIQWMIRNGLGEPIESWAFEMAMPRGHVALLQWMTETDDGASAIVDGLLPWAAREIANGDTLRWLVKERGFRVTHYNAKAAIARRDTASAQWIIGELILRGDFSSSDGEALLEHAITSGAFELVRWFVQDHGLWSHEAFRLASLGASTETLAFVYDTARARTGTGTGSHNGAFIVLDEPHDDSAVCDLDVVTH